MSEDRYSEWYSSICLNVGSAIFGHGIGFPTTTSMDSRFGIGPLPLRNMRRSTPPESDLP